MLRTLRLAERPRSDHEELFLERYDRLFDRARALTRDREQAADLVQDAFVQWTLSRTPLEDIRNVDAFLFTMLQHLHVSHVRRAVRARLVPLDLVEHDSAEIALRGTDAAGRLQASEELQRICEYACSRRWSSRTGSVLLLRYFHGYFVREIARLLKVPPASVDGFLHLARREARSCLRGPSTLATIGPSRPVTMPRPASSTRGDCLNDLRASIFALAHQRCPAEDWLTAAYGPESSSGPSCASIAEIVTCPRCLDAANRHLGLPLLADRYPTDSIGSDRRSGPTPGGPAGPTGGASAVHLRRKAADVFEHRPRQLSVVVNGFFVASQEIGGARCEQTLSLEAGEAIGFIEVFSEQQVRLACAVIQPIPDGPIVQGSRIDLSDARSLEVEVDFAEPRPALRVVYRDPSYRFATEAEGFDETVAARSGDSTLEARPAHGERRPAAPRWWELLFRWTLRPQAIPAAALLLLACWWLYSVVAPPRVTASALLARAVAADEARLRAEMGVEHRVFGLEERAEDGAVVSRARIETWRRAARSATARRVYDEATGVLKAVEIGAAGEPTTVYVRGASPRRLQGSQADALAAIEGGEFWRLDPSAARYLQAVKRLAAPTLEETNAGYLVRSEATGEAGRPIVRIALTLDRGTLRPTAQILLVRGPRGIREYRFTERSLERLPADAGRTGVFEPDPSLSSAPPEPPTLDEAAAPRGLTLDEAASLQVEAFYLLNAAGATRGEQVAVTSNGRRIRVEAVVDSARRKRELLRWLAPLVGTRVEVDVRAIDDGAPRRPRLAPGAARRIEPLQDRVRAYADVRRHLVEHPSLAWPTEAAALDRRIDEEVVRFGADALERSRRVLQRAWALRHLLDQVDPDVAVRLDIHTREKWRAMVREHARACRLETAQLRDALLPVFRPDLASSPVAPESRSEMLTPRAVDEAAATLLALASAQDDAIRSAFAVPAGEASPYVPLTSAGFWAGLRRVESLAGSVADVE